MTCVGAILLMLGQLWRIFAENVSRLTCVFAGAAIQIIVVLVEGPSSKMPSTYCQNRYPSPSRRSGLSRVRPHPFSWKRKGLLNVIAISADCGQSPKKGFAPACVTGETVAAKQFRLREGSSTCSKKPGSSLLSHWWALPLALTTILSAGLPVQQAAQSRPMHWAATPLLVLLSAAEQAYSATTSVSATKVVVIRSTADYLTKSGTIGRIFSVVFFVLPLAERRSAGSI